LITPTRRRGLHTLDRTNASSRHYAQVKRICSVEQTRLGFLFSFRYRADALLAVPASRNSETLTARLPSVCGCQRGHASNGSTDLYARRIPTESFCSRLPKLLGWQETIVGKKPRRSSFWSDDFQIIHRQRPHRHRRRGVHRDLLGHGNPSHRVLYRPGAVCGGPDPGFGGVARLRVRMMP